MVMVFDPALWLWFAEVLRLTAGLMAIQAPHAPLPPARAVAYAVAALEHGRRAGVDPYDLVGIARNESDFREKLVGPDGKDCGLTQTRVTVSRFTCRQLRRSYRLAFREAARELSEYQRACRGKRDYHRCRFNRYNSGVRYARRGRAGGYWLRVTCFAEAARAGTRPGKACRRVRSLADVRRVVGAPTI
jgi:hypothetical protein